MLKYDLDRLGFFQFEWLAQTIVKARFGFSVESWGGSGDFGRDAYSAKSLTSAPDGNKHRGPVIFQAKFVSGANAAGAKYEKSLRAACKSEVKRIHERKAKGQWKTPASYFLITNCPLSTSLRGEIADIFRVELAIETVTLGGSDICAELDIHSTVARSFPQILTYDNLLEQLRRTVDEVVHKEVYTRTESLLIKAKQVIPVFVPTEAFHLTWQVLRKRSFAVLTGPAEMGKTSISWMISLALVASGWQVVDCTSPSDFFKILDPKKPQVFLADDAFGRTEFKLENGQAWERDLEGILNRLDATHYFIWTSRKTVLEEAKLRMDMLGASSAFPAPAEVIVRADKLKPIEKALILYRHAVNASLEDYAKKLLKNHIHQIVNDPDFTPLRISLFVKKSLPMLSEKLKTGSLKPGDATRAIASSIKEVTKQMKTSYEGLTAEHHWLLIALLDESGTGSTENIQALVESLSPIPLTRPATQLLSELDESFLRLQGV